MNGLNKFHIFGLIILFAGCATTVEIPKDVNYDYNVNVDFTKLRTYDLSPIPTTVGIEYLMMERIKTAVHRALQTKNVKRTPHNPDFLVRIYGVRTKVFTTAWTGFDSNPTREKGKLILQFLDPSTKRLLWWGETRALLEPYQDPLFETRLVNDVVQRILQKFPPVSS